MVDQSLRFPRKFVVDVAERLCCCRAIIFWLCVRPPLQALLVPLRASSSATIELESLILTSPFNNLALVCDWRKQLGSGSVVMGIAAKERTLWQSAQFHERSSVVVTGCDLMSAAIIRSRVFANRFRLLQVRWLFLGKRGLVRHVKFFVENVGLP